MADRIKDFISLGKKKLNDLEKTSKKVLATGKDLIDKSAIDREKKMLFNQLGKLSYNLIKTNKINIDDTEIQKIIKKIDKI